MEGHEPFDLKQLLMTTEDLDDLVLEAEKNPIMLKAIIELLCSETSSIKFTATKIIRLLSERTPKCVYPYFDEIVSWMHHTNSFIKWDAIRILANLCAVDVDQKFMMIYDDYFSLLHDQKMITAATVIGNAWKIIEAWPALEREVTFKLLEVPNITYFDKGEPSPECNCIACGHLLDCFDRYFDQSKLQPQILSFATNQLTSSRKAVIKKAERFMKNHSAGV